MSEGMLLEISLLDELFVAEGALVGLDIIVHSQMVSHVVLLPKLLVAVAILTLIYLDNPLAFGIFFKFYFKVHLCTLI